VALDERLRRELGAAGRPVDPTGVYERLIQRRERRRMVRRAQQGALAIAVVTGTVAGAVGLSAVFRPGDRQEPPIATPSGPIAYVESRSSEGSTIWLINPDGSGRRQLLAVQGSIRGREWSPDGTKLAFDADRAIQVINADGTGLIRLTDGQTLASMPTWSPDGTKLAFTMSEGNDSEIVVVNADGSGRTIVTALGNAAWPDWSPNGREIVFVGPGPAGDRQAWDIYVMNADGSNVRNLTDSASVDLDPQWSPDGDRILFHSQRNFGGESLHENEIYVMDSDGTNEVRLTNDGATDQFPVWSPDGSQVAFTSFEAGTQGAVQLVVVNLDGSNRRVIAEDLLGVVIAWQPAPVGASEPPSPSPSATASPTVEPSPEDPRITDVGLGLRLCDVSSLRGTFLDAYPDSTAFVGAEPTPSGRCRLTEEMFGVIAIDLSGDGVADIASEPFSCQTQCGAFAAPDVDGDGIDEILAINVGFSVVGLRLFDVVPNEDAPAIVPVMVEPPGDAVLGYQGFDGSGPPQFWIGGDGFGGDALRCETEDGRRLLVSSTAQMVPPDSPDSVWEVHETTFVLEDVVLRVIGARDYEAADPSAFMGTGGCGARMVWP
jgi:Tol biopolymer transport system component